MPQRLVIFGTFVVTLASFDRTTALSVRPSDPSCTAPWRVLWSRRNVIPWRKPVPRFTEVELEARSRLVSGGKGYQERAPFRESLSGLDNN